VSVGAYPNCYRVRIGDDHDRDCVIGVVWSEDGELDAMGDGGGLVWNVFWGCRSVGIGGRAYRAGVQAPDKVRGGKVIGIDARDISGDGCAISYSQRCQETGRVVWIPNDHH